MTVVPSDALEVLTPLDGFTFAPGNFMDVRVSSGVAPGVVIGISWATAGGNCYSANGIVYVEVGTPSGAPTPPASETPPSCPAMTAALAAPAEARAAQPCKPATPPKRDPCVVPNRKFAGKTPAERAYYRELALAFNENAWDGQQLAEETDLLGKALKWAIDTAVGDDVDLDPAEPAIAAVQETLAEEAELVEKRQKLMADMKLATMDRDAAELRRSATLKEKQRLEREIADLRKKRDQGKNISGKRVAERERDLQKAKAALELADDDVDAARAAWTLAHGRIGALDRELAGVRRALGQQLRGLARALGGLPGAKFLGRVLGVANLFGDAGALWMVPNAILAAYFNTLAKPPPGCNEPWSPKLPKRAGVSSVSTGGVAASRPAPRAFLPVASAFKPMVAGPFISRRQAAAFARFSDSLIDQLATVRALQHEVKRSRDGSSKGVRVLSRRLGRLLRQAPSRYRALASALAFEPVAVTPEALAARDPAATLARVRGSLKLFGAPRALISGVDGSLDATAAGDLVDPLALLRDPALDELGRKAAKVLR